MELQDACAQDQGHLLYVKQQGTIALVGHKAYFYLACMLKLAFQHADSLDFALMELTMKGKCMEIRHSICRAASLDSLPLRTTGSEQPAMYSWTACWACLSGVFASQARLPAAVVQHQYRLPQNCSQQRQCQKLQWCRCQQQKIHLALHKNQRLCIHSC